MHVLLPELSKALQGNRRGQGARAVAGGPARQDTPAGSGAEAAIGGSVLLTIGDGMISHA